MQDIEHHPSRRFAVLRRFVIAVLLSLTTLGSDCEDDPADGTLWITFLPTGTVDGVTSIEIHATRVDVVHSETLGGPEEVITVATVTLPVVIDVSGGVAEPQSALFAVPNGFVHQVRFITDTITAVIDGQPIPIKLPSGPQTGLKLKPCDGAPPFPIVTGAVTFVDSVFDAAEQVVTTGNAKNGKGKGPKYIVKPVICGEVVVDDEGDPSTPLLPQFVEDEIFVMFDAGTTDAAAQGLATALSATVKSKSHRHPWYVFSLPAGSDEQTIAGLLGGLQGIVSASPNYNAQALNLLPADFSGPGDTDEHWLFTTQSPEAWEGTTGDPRIVIAVHDSGGNPYHEELQENVFINVAEIPSTVTTSSNCSALAPADQIDLSALVLDADGDEVTSLRDFNLEPNKSLLLAALVLHGRTPTSTTGDVRLEDLIDPFGSSCGLFEDLADGDNPAAPAVAPNNGHVDDLIGWDFIDDDNSPFTFGGLNDCTKLDHGGAVAGVAASTEDASSIFNDDDVRRAPNYVGQAWRARILPVRAIQDGTEAGRAARVDSLAYAIELGAHIVNMSWSEGCGPDKPSVPQSLRCTIFDRTFKEVTMFEQFSEAQAQAGGTPLIVVGGINRDFNLDEAFIQDLPNELALPNIVSVTSVDENDTFPTDGKASYGDQTYDIAAPGRNMPLLAASTILLATDPDGALFACDGLWKSMGETNLAGGNSFAAPQIAGVAALVLSKELQDNNVLLTTSEVRARILDNADILPDLAVTRVSFGRRLNACRAVFDGPCPF